MAEEVKLSPVEEENRRNVEAMQKAQKEQEEKDKKEHKLTGGDTRENAPTLEGDIAIVRSNMGTNSFVRLPKSGDRIQVFSLLGTVVVLPPDTSDPSKPAGEQPAKQVFLGAQSEIVVTPKGGAIFHKVSETEWGVIGAATESVH